jgi:hypothetical protein
MNPVKRLARIRSYDSRGEVIQVIDKKVIALVLLVVGIVILGLSLLADPIGLGEVGSSFGPRQIIGTVVGALAIVVGLILRLRTQSV